MEITEKVAYLKGLMEGMKIDTESNEGKILAAMADILEDIGLELEVTATEPGVKGDTATNVTKPATLETGAIIKVPLFINEGEKIQVDTRTGEYLGRVKE